MRFCIVSHPGTFYSISSAVELTLLGESHLHLTIPRQWHRHQVDSNRRIPPTALNPASNITRDSLVV